MASSPRPSCQLVEEVETNNDFRRKGGKVEDEEEEEQTHTSLELDDKVEADQEEVPSSGGASFFEVLSVEQLLALMKELVQTASGLLHLPPSTVHQLLSHFRWDQAKLLDAYFSAADSDASLSKLFKDARAPRPEAAGLPVPSFPELSPPEDSCQVCGTEMLESHDMFGLSCGHLFCKPCWSNYLTLQILEEGTPLISCLAPSCYQLVRESAVLQLVTDPKTRSKYEALIPQHFVSTHPLLKWCPAPDCPNAVKIRSCDYRLSSVTCICGHAFCFACTEPAHEPVDCLLLSQWKADHDDMGTTSWLVDHSKSCPLCHAPIEKNGGCNYMQCQSCKYAFCWICMGAWENHDWWRCTRFTSDHDIHKTGQSGQMAKLERYQFYYTRYANHLGSLRLEEKLFQVMDGKMQEIQRISGWSWVEVQFMKRAVDTLHRCRQTLMHTYVFAFYGDNNEGQHDQLAIFEGNQQDLAEIVEKLSGYLERELLDEERSGDVNRLRQRVQDMTIYCEGRRQVLLDHVNEGKDNGWWKVRNFS